MLYSAPPHWQASAVHNRLCCQICSDQQNNSPRPLINTFCHQHCFLLRHSYLLIKVKKRQNVPNSLNLKCRTHCKTPLHNKNDSLLQIISMATHREISVQSRESSALERDLAPPLSLLLLLFLLPTTYLPSLPPIPSYPSVELSSFCMLINIPPLRSFLHMLGFRHDVVKALFLSVLPLIEDRGSLAA